MESQLTYKIILVSFTMPLILVSVLAWVLLRYQKKQSELELEKKDNVLREKELIIQKQQALQNERTRIAAEMHDDLGGGLTTIKFLGQKLLRKTTDLEHKTEINKIVSNSQSLVSNMSEIIWAMNAGFDTLDSLVAYVRRYASEYLGNHEMRLEHKVTNLEKAVEVTGEKRRHIYLVIKELLHNIVKHADAKQVQLNWAVQVESLQITLSDDGIGIGNDNEEDPFQLGHGLLNIKKRIQQLDGTIVWETNNGTITKIDLPLNPLATPLTQEV